MGKNDKKHGGLGVATLAHLEEVKSSSLQLAESIAELEQKTYGSSGFAKQLKALEDLIESSKKAAKESLHSLKKEQKKHQKALEAAKQETKPATKKHKTPAKKAEPSKSAPRLES